MPVWREVRRLGLRWRLRQDCYLDRELLRNGIFEGRSTAIVRGLLKPGMQVIDVGANFGYYTLMFAKLVGPTGRVYAFEPTSHYRERLEWHLRANPLLNNVTVFPFGLSDQERRVHIELVESSASCHSPEGTTSFGSEFVSLRPLDELFVAGKLTTADLVKLDIDGHEPFFVTGATEFLRSARPALLVEFSQANLEVAGSSALALQDQFHSLGYDLFSETTGEPFRTRFAFLAECGNYSHSANVWAFPRERGLSTLRQAFSA